MTLRLKDYALTLGALAAMTVVNVVSVWVVLHELPRFLPPPDADEGPGAGIGGAWWLYVCGFVGLPLVNLFLIAFLITLRRSLRRRFRGPILPFATLLLFLGLMAFLVDGWALLRFSM